MAAVFLHTSPATNRNQSSLKPNEWPKGPVQTSNAVYMLVRGRGVMCSKISLSAVQTNSICCLVLDFLLKYEILGKDYTWINFQSYSLFVRESIEFVWSTCHTPVLMKISKTRKDSAQSLRRSLACSGTLHSIVMLEFSKNLGHHIKFCDVNRSGKKLTSECYDGATNYVQSWMAFEVWLRIIEMLRM